MSRARDIANLQSSKITADAGIDIDNINIDGTEIDLSSGDLTIDVEGDITLDANGGNIFFKDNGTEFLEFEQDGGGCTIRVDAANTDLKFVGNDSDGGGTITALTLDMSDAGKAIFNSGATFGYTSGRVPVSVLVPHSNSAIANAMRISTYGVGGYSSSNSIGAGARLEFGQYDDGYDWVIGSIATVRTGGSWAGALTFYTNNDSASSNNTERMRIDSSGVVTVGTSSKTTDTDIKLINDNRTFGIRADRAGSYFSVVDFSAGENRLVIDSSGNVGIGSNIPSSSYKFINQSSANQIVQLSYNSNASFTQDVHNWDTIRAATDAFNFFRARTNVGGSPDSEMILQGNGNFAIDGTVTENGADYAEYFEWKDGNSDSEDRVGITVKLDGDKIVPSTSDDNASVIIGVISGKPSVVGDAAWNKWKNKHETDDYGRYVWEEYTFTEWTIPATETEDAVNHIYPTDYIPSDLTVPSDATVVSKDEDGNKLMRRKLNSSFNPSTTYIPREQRPEWDAVGMMGKLRIRKGQTVGDRWIKMRDVSSSVEEWLVK